MLEIIISLSIIVYVLFIIGLSMVATHNILSIKREKKKLSDRIKGLSQKTLQRKIMLSGRYFTLQQIKDNPNLLDFLSHEDQFQFNEDGNFFAERKNSLKNNFNRKVFDLPAEALHRKVELPSGEKYILKDFKRKPWILKKFSKNDFEEILSKRGLFRLRLDPQRIASG